jgi:hypothetical protein
MVNINSSSRDFLPALRDRVPFSCGNGPFAIGTNTRLHPLWRIVYNNLEALALCQWMYADSSDLRLERKFAIYQEALEGAAS